MARKIYKYELADNYAYQIPTGFIIRHVAEQYGRLTMWVEVDTEQPNQNVVIYSFGTGHEIPAEYIYIGTGLEAGDMLVWHYHYKENSES